MAGVLHILRLLIFTHAPSIFKALRNIDLHSIDFVVECRDVGFERLVYFLAHLIAYVVKIERKHLPLDLHDPLLQLVERDFDVTDSLLIEFYVHF